MQAKHFIQFTLASKYSEFDIKLLKLYYKKKPFENLW